MAEHTPAPTPSRGVYGFALYLTCVCSFILYMAWATVPDSVLHYVGITYYPQKYWAVALPVYCLMALALFAFFIYPSLNLMLTPALKDMSNITDSYAIYRPASQSLNREQNEGRGESDVHGIPPVSDIHISQVCRILYAER